VRVHFESRRFGPLDLGKDQVIEFPSGLIGLGGSRYALVSTDDDSPFSWLQSLEDPDLAVPVTNPFWFFADYEVNLSDADSARVGTESPEAVDVWVTVRALPDEVTANLKAPIVVHAGRGHQVINEAREFGVRTPLAG
jgi:flagellar assembly factor FliW